LYSPGENSKTLAIVAHYRDHSTQVFSQQELPVKLSVVKQGSPHKLVLEKRTTLHKETAERFNILKMISSKLR
jgi:hypothetical protein